jgi:hypothetical protein
MATRKVNPFHILGLRAEALRGISDEQLDGVIQASYRALSCIHHPDKGGRPEAFRRLAWAQEQLVKDSTTWEYWKERFFQLRREQTAELTSRIDALQAALEQSQEQAMAYMRAQVETETPTACNFVSGRIRVANTLDAALQFKGVSMATLHRLERSAKDRFMEMFELHADAVGGLSKQVLVQAPLDEDTEIPESSKEHRRDPKRSYYWKVSGEMQEMPGCRLLGSMHRDASLDDDGKNVRVSALLQGPICQDHYRQVREGFTDQEFRLALPHIRPALRVDDYLVAVRLEHADLRFLLLGQIRAITHNKEG